MKWSNLPSLNALRAFSAVAENSSYTKAATQLNVTHAAVNQQVKALENHLSLALVMRAGRGIVLTAEGLQLARCLDRGFDTIRAGLDALANADAARPVQITMSPAFAAEWLMPRITDFHSRYPEITLLFNPTADIVTLKPGGIELAIRYGQRAKLTHQPVTVLESDMVVIGTPDLVANITNGEPSALLQMPWLQELGTTEVADWFQRRGITPQNPITITQMPGNLIMHAVRRGDGLTYSARLFQRRNPHRRTNRAVLRS